MSTFGSVGVSSAGTAIPSVSVISIGSSILFPESLSVLVPLNGWPVNSTASGERHLWSERLLFVSRLRTDRRCSLLGLLPIRLSPVSGVVSRRAFLGGPPSRGFTGFAASPTGGFSDSVGLVSGVCSLLGDRSLVTGTNSLCPFLAASLFSSVSFSHHAQVR